MRVTQVEKAESEKSEDSALRLESQKTVAQEVEKTFELESKAQSECLPQENDASETDRESHKIIGPITHDPEIFKLFQNRARQTPKTSTAMTFEANQTNLDFLEEFQPISDKESETQKQKRLELNPRFLKQMSQGLD